VILVTLLLAGLLSWRRLPGVLHAQSSLELHSPLQKPVEIAAAVALIAWFVGPWAPSLISMFIVAPTW
jgi:hypothetical protein